MPIKIYSGTSGGGGTGNPGGASGSVQFNNAGNFGGNVNFTYDGTNASVVAPTTDLHATNKLYVDSITGSIPGGADTQVQFNNAGNFDANANFTYDGDNVSIVAPTADAHAATKLYVDNTSGENPGGADTQVQFNNAGTFDANANFTYDGTNASIVAPTADAHAATKLYVDNTSGENPGGADTQVQFNNAGTFDANANFTYDGTNASIVVPTADAHAATKLYVDNSIGNSFDVIPSSATGDISLYEYSMSDSSTLELFMDMDNYQLKLSRTGAQEGWIVSSIDGVNNLSVNDITYLPSSALYVVVNATPDFSVYYSLDLISWFPASIGGSIAPMHSIASSDDIPSVGTYVCVGEDGAIMRSLNGTEFIPLTPVGTEHWNSIIVVKSAIIPFGQATIYVAVGNFGSLMYSTDAVIWNSEGPLLAGDDLHTIVYNDFNKQYTISANGGEILNSFAVFQGWTYATTTGVSASLYGVTFIPGTNIYVAVGDLGTITKSVDGGDNWVSQTSPTSEVLISVMYISSKFVATGLNGTIVISEDGENWSIQTSGTTNQINKGKEVNKNVVYLGEDSTLGLSNDEPIIMSFYRDSRIGDDSSSTFPANIDPVSEKVSIVNVSNYFSASGIIDNNLSFSTLFSQSDFKIFVESPYITTPTLLRIEILSSGSGTEGNIIVRESVNT